MKTRHVGMLVLAVWFFLGGSAAAVPPDCVPGDTADCTVQGKPGTQTCTGKKWGPCIAVGCDGKTTQCGNRCVDTSGDNANCGSCGVACTGGKICKNRVCTAPSPLSTLVKQFTGFDRNKDGAPAIERLAIADFSPGDPAPDRDLVLVLVEERLLAAPAGAEDLRPRLARFERDLAADGFEARSIAAKVYAGPVHQDGRTLLAMRAFLRAVWDSYPRLRGVILVGSFPEATLVRSAIWPRRGQAWVINGKKWMAPAGKPRSFVAFPPGEPENKPGYGDYDWVSLGSEMIAARAEIVLADLTGNWDSLYNQDPREFEQIQALPDAGTVWPAAETTYTSSIFQVEKVTWRDFFWIHDDKYTRLASPPNQLKLQLSTPEQHPELSAADRQQVNPIARPDILVSRINARNIATNPDPGIKGDDGRGFLDADGLPQVFRSGTGYNVMDILVPDARLEWRLLTEFLDRDHAFRAGLFADLMFRSGTVHYDIYNEGGDYLAAFGRAAGPPLSVDQASVLDFVNWLKSPAVLRVFMAHSDGQGSTLGNAYAPSELEAAVGGRPFQWMFDGKALARPDMAAQLDTANLFLYRSLWNSGVLAGTGANLFIHGGCGVNDVIHTQDVTYNNPGYSPGQNAEGILFYLNGLAIVARAKIYYDVPRPLPDDLATTARIGDVWTRYFAAEAATSMDKGHVPDHKKVYPWSVLGDWTLRARYQPQNIRYVRVESPRRAGAAGIGPIESFERNGANPIAPKTVSASSGSGVKTDFFQIDYGSPRAITAVRLQPKLDPAAPPSADALYNVLVSNDGTNYTLLTSFSGRFRDSGWLTYPPKPPASPAAGDSGATAARFRFLKVESFDNESWTAWREIEVYDGKGTRIIPSSATVSRSTQNDTPDKSYDKNGETLWSGGFANGWIVLDQGTPRDVSKIRLSIGTATDPKRSTHNLYVSNDGTRFKLVKTFKGSYVDRQWLEFVPPK